MKKEALQALADAADALARLARIFAGRTMKTESMQPRICPRALRVEPSTHGAALEKSLAPHETDVDGAAPQSRGGKRVVYGQPQGPWLTVSRTSTAC
jgi:hypothetical protein